MAIMIFLKRTFKISVYVFAFIGFVLVGGFFAIKFGFTNTKGIIDTQTEEFHKLGQATGAGDQITASTTPHIWNIGEEWDNFTTAIKKDKDVLSRVESETGVPARLIISPIFVEQMRLYYSERETFKTLFEPLKILGTQTQFSWGIGGIKEATAIQIENNLKDKTSIYYLGPKYENVLDFKTTNITQERFTRMTDYKDRYYQYLYIALYIKELGEGWQKSGTDIVSHPEIIATLFNIGFDNSKPNPNPQVGGAEITIGGIIYSFGRLAGEFYYSKELSDYFPKKDLILEK